ncbi:MAG: hypothetical protein CMM26_07465 [Rhodospirillaceae bacterium]|nr:hypothetical protein [Rhodospirillaceae bacterium]|tara:strand:+ start:966 stop:1469 length:504 start_codon:yes stop_codon:yes gene_type:complete
MINALQSLRSHLLFLAAAIALTACTQSAKLQPTSTGKSGDNTGIEKNFSLLTDIPIPQDSTLDVDRSLILGDLDRWTGRIVLNVGQGTTQTFALYQTQMSNFGWKPIMSVQADTSVLSFTRGERAATVQIDKRTLGGSTTTITVAPRHSGLLPSTGANAPVKVAPAR